MQLSLLFEIREKRWGKKKNKQQELQRVPKQDQLSKVGFPTHLHAEHNGTHSRHDTPNIQLFSLVLKRNHLISTPGQSLAQGEPSPWIHGSPKGNHPC